MSKDGYLPPGVEDSDLPGNRPEDAEWEQMVDALLDDVDSLYDKASSLLRQSRYFRLSSLVGVKSLVQAALEEVL